MSSWSPVRMMRQLEEFSLLDRREGVGLCEWVRYQSRVRVYEVEYVVVLSTLMNTKHRWTVVRGKDCHCTSKPLSFRRERCGHAGWNYPGTSVVKTLESRRRSRFTPVNLREGIRRCRTRLITLLSFLVGSGRQGRDHRSTLPSPQEGRNSGSEGTKCGTGTRKMIWVWR